MSASPKPPRRLRFEPFFRAHLVQLTRRGEAEAAARLAAAEVIQAIADRRRPKPGGVATADDDEGGRELMVPTAERTRALQQAIDHELTPRTPNRNQDRGDDYER